MQDTEITAAGTSRPVQVGPLTVGGGAPLALIAGPCVIESFALAFEVASFLKDCCHRIGMPLIFKSSYDKANRSSVTSFRGPGMVDGLAVLGRIRRELDIPVISDVHRIEEVQPAAEVLDILQIPAFLCRQTDLLQAAARTGRPLNVKKGQFLAPWDMRQVVAKVEAAGNRRILLTERGASFGYNNLVVDFRSIPIMQSIGYPVIFDATHSVQLPGAAGDHSGGQRQFAPLLAASGVAAGADAVFMEVHPDPDRALCDGANSLPLEAVEPLLIRLQAIHRAISPETVPPAP
ncbi:MAG: 3-deoxy-8-phosphooctulonate synthase [Desulfobacterales bacterium]|nr:3-deoxy-8-phosphooctulonate synthase [Desulfobacterales bacterium]